MFHLFDHRYIHSSMRDLIGVSNPGLMDERVLHSSRVFIYRSRTMAVGAFVTIASVFILLAYSFIPGNKEIKETELILLTAACLLLSLGYLLTPWSKIIGTVWAVRALHAWSVVSILIIGLAIYLDGGSSSPVYNSFYILAPFFAISYSRRIYFLFLSLAISVYCLAVAFAGWNISAALLFARISTMFVASYGAGVLAGWLISEMTDGVKSSTTAEQRAGVLDVVARSARRVSSLDVSHVLGGALAGVLELGGNGAEVWINDGNPVKLELQRKVGRGIDSEDFLEQVSLTGNLLAVELFNKTRIHGTSQIIEDGQERLVASLLYREGEPAGVMIVRMSLENSSDTLMIECMELLTAQISAGLDVARNVTERRNHEERFAHWAFHDALTDLPNRVLFADRLELALARTVRDGTKVAVLFLDLDDFKHINDTLGHAAGDELLRTVARRLHSCLRPNDSLARYGGDEFVILVEGIQETETAILVANRIIDSLSVPVVVLGHSLTIKTSIGIALTCNKPGADTDVVRRADIAMYEAKAMGGSGYVVSKIPDISEQSNYVDKHIN